MRKVGDWNAQDTHVRATNRRQVAQRVGDRRAHAAFSEPILDGDHQMVPGGVGQQLGVQGLDHPWVPHGAGDALVGKPIGGILGGGQHLAHPDQAHVGGLVGAGASSRQARPHLVGSDVWGGGLGPTDGSRAVAEVECVAHHLRQLLIRRGGEHHHVWNLGQQHHVQQAMVGGAIVAGHARTIEAKEHRQVVQAHVQVHLVERPGEEGGVHGEDRPQPHHGHAGGRGHGMLLGDAHIEDPIGEPLHHGQQPNGVGHGGGQGHHLRAGCGFGDDRFGERVGVTAFLHRAHVVQVLHRVVLGGCVAPTLLGQNVNHHRAVHLLGRGQRCFQRVDVVAVEGAQV